MVRISVGVRVRVRIRVKVKGRALGIWYVQQCVYNCFFCAGCGLVDSLLPNFSNDTINPSTTSLSCFSFLLFLAA